MKISKLTEEQKELVSDNHNLIYSFLHSRHLYIEDWYDIAAIGLVKAGLNFKPDNGATFSTYAYFIMNNEVLIEKRKQNAVCRADDKSVLYYDNINIKEVKTLTKKEYYARGCTALLDAIGKTVNSVGARLSSTEESQRPEKVIVVITTDGFENSSCEFTKTKVKEMIEDQQNKYNWTFMFLGANMDAVGEARSLGINTDYARTYTATNSGTQSVYTSLSKGMSVLRSSEAVLTNEQTEKLKCCLDSIE